MRHHRAIRKREKKKKARALKIKEIWTGSGILKSRPSANITSGLADSRHQEPAMLALKNVWEDLTRPEGVRGLQKDRFTAIVEKKWVSLFFLKWKVWACVAHPAAAAASLLLLLLLDQLHGGGRGRGRSHGPDHLDAVLRQRGQVETLAAPHLHLLELLEAPQGELEEGGGMISCHGRRNESKTQTGSGLRTRIVFQSRRSTFFMGKCGAFMLQNLVTMVKRRRAKGSPLYRGEPSEEQDRKLTPTNKWLLLLVSYGKTAICTGILIFLFLVSRFRSRMERK